MKTPKRLTVKLFIDNPAAVRSPEIVPIFQRWIQDSRLEGLLIDVVDYQHVPNGPGIILIGHEGDYAYDFADNRVGIQYTFKQTADYSLSEALTIAVHRVSLAAHELEAEASLGEVRINANELQISFRDRLNFPNDAETQEALITAVEPVLAQAYSSDFTISVIEGDLRDPLRLQILSSENLTIADLIRERV